jgi:NADP-dependent alcohol dehydrogenase
MQLPTRLSAYGINANIIPSVVEQLKAHGMVKLGEKMDVTPELVEIIIKECL